MEKYKFDRDIKILLRPLYGRDNYHALLALGEDILIIFIAIYLAIILPWAYPLSWIIIGSRQRSLATLLHESSHKTLAKNKHLNYFIGMISGFFILQKYKEYYISHVIKHHTFLGDKDKDPDYKHHINMGLYEKNIDKKDLVRKIFNPFWILKKTPTQLNYLFKNRFLKNFSIYYITIWAVFIFMLYYFDFLILFVVFWVVPFLTSFQIINWLCELSEHFPKMKKNTTNIGMSRNRLGGRIENFFFGMHNENYHLVHHINPGIPFWNLPKAHKIYMKDTFYESKNRNKGGIFSTLHGENVVNNIMANI